MYPEEVPEAFFVGADEQFINSFCFCGTIRIGRPNYEDYCEYMY